MKSLLALTLLTTLFSQSLFADELLCASKKDQTLYFTSGQIRMTALIANSKELTNISLTTSGNDKLGSSDEAVRGNVQGKYVRFNLYGDAWCSYKLTLPKDFMTQEKAVAFVDAYCEENANSSIRLNCIIQ